MSAVLVIVVGFVALFALMVWQRRKVFGWLIVEPPPSPNVVDPHEDPLLGAVEMLSRRVTLAEAINATLRRVVMVLVPVVIVLVPVAVISLTAAITANSAVDQQAAETQARRAAFCHSLDDIGASSEVAANGAAEGLLTTFFDPQLAALSGRPPSDPAVVTFFEQLLRANTKEQVHAAVAAEIAAVKMKNGFSEDCTKIGKPSG